MDQHTLLQRCQQIAGQSGTAAPADFAAQAGSATWTADDAIGFFQAFRPDGVGLGKVFEGVPHGEELLARLHQVFAASGSGARGDGMRDAYFVVRQPANLPPQRVEAAGRQWLANLAELDQQIGSGELRELLEPLPRIRVLVGNPPKHPRDPAERSRLLLAINAFSERFVGPLRPSGDAALGLRQAYYYIACDAYLRDHLLWPLYRQVTGMSDPHEPYFQLWEHGIKFRIFNDEEIDFYIPRSSP
ncbi:apolipoprotein acyltransferase [Candidatus Laterigemmans baculatus]|uniref:apolipoprotein acyltransferase n=1 Tax=Candidatus Laterigemmans baculatus TaxID=2770505 RepID=UPI0013D99C0D|nr:apolipoprotein acyltransferase [Candidatus Laterigemmans baculatus]